MTKLLSDTLPTIVGMGVVYKTTETLFRRRKAAAKKKTVKKRKPVSRKRKATKHKPSRKR